MYNMNLGDLKKLKGLPDIRRSLLDFMGKDELAGNLFRLTLTEGRIKRKRCAGSGLLRVSRTGWAEGQGMMIEETGIAPEALPVGQDIRSIPGSLRAASKDSLPLMILRAKKDGAEWPCLNSLIGPLETISPSAQNASLEFIFTFRISAVHVGVDRERRDRFTLQLRLLRMIG